MIAMTERLVAVRRIRDNLTCNEHPRLLTLAATSAAVDIIVGFTDSSRSVVGVMLMMMHAIAMIGMGIQPLIGAYAVVLCSMASVLTPGVPGNDQALGLCLAIGVIAVLLPGKNTVTVVAAINAVDIAAAIPADQLVVHAVIAGGLNALSAIIGWSVRQSQKFHDIRERNLQLERDSERLRHMHHSLRIARTLHDSLTNDLALLSLIAQTAMRGDGVSPAERESWNLVYDHVQLAFSHTHRILDQLSEDGDAGASARRTPTPQSADLATHLGDMERRLHQAGFKGLCAADGPNIILSPIIYDEIDSLITESCTNIIKHCQKADGTFFMLLTIERHGIHFMQMNSTNSTGVMNHSIPESGRGLQYHQMIIQSLHGTLECRDESNVWTMQAFIPIAGTSRIATQ